MKGESSMAADERSQLDREVRAFLDHCIDQTGGEGISRRRLANKLIENPRFAAFLVLRGAFACVDECLPAYMATIDTED
jgi:hypothetical protein